MHLTFKIHFEEKTETMLNLAIFFPSYCVTCISRKMHQILLLACMELHMRKIKVYTFSWLAFN